MSFDENCPQNKPISASAHAFLVFSGYLWFSMGNIKVATWNGLKILIPKHMWKSKIGLLEQIWGQNPYDAFFLGHPVHTWILSSWTLSLSLSVCLCHLHLPNIIKVPTNQRHQNEFRSIWNMAEFCNNEERLKLGLRLFIHFHQISRQNCLSLIM